MDPALAATMSKEQLQLLLDIMQESRRISEAEAKKKEETRKTMEIQFHMERYRHELMSQGSTTAPTFPRSDPSMFGSSSMADLTRPSDDLMSSDHLNMGLSSQSISNLFPVVSSVGFGLQPSSNMGTYHHASDTSSGGTLNANGGSTVFSPAQGLPQIPTSGHPGDASNWIQDLLHSVDGSPNIDPAFDQDEYLSMDFGFLDKLVPPAPAPTPSTSASPPPSETISSTKSKIYRSPVSRYISTPDLKPLPAATHLIATGDGDALPPIHLSKSSVCHPCRCLECDVGIGVVILYGSEQELQDPVSIEISCANCTTKRDSNLVERSTPFKLATESASKKRRARTAGRERVVYCEACNRRVGFGGVRAGDKDLKFEDKERDWIETRASVEPICVACVRNFDFCTQCGGGGKFRTGRWRPRELFEMGRKTCTLSHERMGVIDHFKVTTYRCPVDAVEDEHGNRIGEPFDPEPVVARTDATISAHFENLRQRGALLDPETAGIEILRRRRDEFEFMYRTRHLGAFATAAYMATHSYIQTWDKFREFAELRRRQITMLLLGGYILPSVGGDSTSTSPDDTRQFLAVVDALKPRRTVRRKSSGNLNMMTGDGDESVDPRDSGLILVGYIFLEWFIPQRHVNAVHLLYVGKDSVEDGVDSPFKVMMSSGVQRIMDDVGKFGHPEPEHLWARVSRVDVAERMRYVIQLEKLGFFGIEEYCSVFGHDAGGLESMFGSFIVPRDSERLYTLLVCRWADIKRSTGL